MRLIMRAVIMSVAVLAGAVRADDHYVAQNGQTETSPYTNGWASAASNIQDAVNAAAIDDTVWVGPGRYTMPSNATNYLGTNVVYINKPLTLQASNSVSSLYIIDGGGANRGVAWYYASASPKQFVIDGFTITNCLGLGMGGGIYYAQASYTGAVRNCVITDNRVLYSGGVSQGGGIYSSYASVSNCVIKNNRAVHGGAGSGLESSGGGIYSPVALKFLTDCRIEGNEAVNGGGTRITAWQTFKNCVFKGNRALQAGSGVALNVIGGGAIKNGGFTITLYNCLIQDNITDGSGYGAGGGGISIDWGAGLYMYNCTIVSNWPTGLKLRSNGTVVGYNSIFYYNYNGSDFMLDATPAPFTLTNVCIASTNGLTGLTIGSWSALPPTFVNLAGGDYRLAPWSRGVDTGTWQTWMTNSTDLAGNPRISANNLPDIGAYETTAGPAGMRYVAQQGQTPVSPYTSWASAASNIEDAISVMTVGETILVSNGVYTLTNSVTLGDGRLRSYNNGAIDRAGTIINGNWPNVTNRCFVMTHPDATIEGFTITNGYVVGNGGAVNMSGGTLRNCLVMGNTATNGSGGGVYATGANSLVTNCDIINNLAMNTTGGGGGVRLDSSAQLWSSLILSNACTKAGSGGGGVYCGSGTVVANCSIISNKLGTAYDIGTADGGGAVWAPVAAMTLRNCLIVGNGRGSYDKGAVGSTEFSTGAVIENCTIAKNIGSAVYSLGFNSQTLKVLNTICYYNTVAGMSTGQTIRVVASNCCVESTTGIMSGSGNITTPPCFVNRLGADYRQSPWSAGVDAGLVLPWMSSATDLAGQPRINGQPDIGAYETAPGSAPIQYVASGGQTPTPPYTNGWASAASNIEDAVGVGFEGVTMLVSNGVYTPAYRIPPVGNLRIQSFNSAALDRDGTIVNGGYPEKTNRCFVLYHPLAVLEGFTITNSYEVGDGGGVYMTAGTLRNCLITMNTATNGRGGGVYATGASTLISNCDVVANLALYTNGLNANGGGGGVYLDSSASLQNSRILFNNCPIVSSGGGGVYCSWGTTVLNCSIISNKLGASYASGAALGGAGVWSSPSQVNATLRNCLIVGNGMGVYSGAVGSPEFGNSSVIENCTIANNWGYAIYAAGWDSTTLRVLNTICYLNGSAGMNKVNNTSIIASNCCVAVTNGLTSYSVTTTNDPRFASVTTGNYRLKGTSPCINAGMLLPWMIAGVVDLDGNARISPLINGTVDMGAYEFPVSQGSVFQMR